MDNGTKTARTIGEAVREMNRAFSNAGIETPALDARLLAAYATGTGKDLSFTNPDFTPGAEFSARLSEVTARRLAGEPVHRIVGEREFYGLSLALSPDTLEPRPDTETLVDAVLPFVADVANSNGSCCILDLGTGTGAIGLAIAHQEPRATVLAADIAAGAVETANANARALGLAARFHAVQSDWFAQTAGLFDLIVSNPPYVPAGEIALLDRGVREHDPLLALDGGNDGLDAYRAIARDARAHLAAGGRIAVEAGRGQTQAIRYVFERAGFAVVACKTDLSGIERVAIIEFTGKISGQFCRAAKKQLGKGDVKG